MAAYKISMKMCFKNIFNGSISFPGKLHVGFNISKRVNNGCFSIAFNKISSFTETPGVQLLYIHLKNLYKDNNVNVLISKQVSGSGVFAYRLNILTLVRLKQINKKYLF